MKIVGSGSAGSASSAQAATSSHDLIATGDQWAVDAAKRFAKLQTEALRAELEDLNPPAVQTLANQLKSVLGDNALRERAGVSNTQLNTALQVISEVIASKQP